MTKFPEKVIASTVERIKLPKVEEHIMVTEDELRQALQLLWPDQIPANASICSLAEMTDSDNPDDNFVVSVRWHRDPEPGEYERLEAKRKAAEQAEEEGVEEYEECEEEEDDEDDGEDDDDDDDDVTRCTSCRRRRGEAHRSDCPRRSHKRQRVTSADCDRRLRSKKKLRHG